MGAPAAAETPVNAAPEPADASEPPVQPEPSVEAPGADLVVTPDASELIAAIGRAEAALVIAADSHSVELTGPVGQADQEGDNRQRIADVALHDWLEHREANEVVDLRGYDLRSNSFTGLTVENVWFGHGAGGQLEPALLTGVSFRDATLVGVSFADTDLDHVDFRGTTLKRCDFRRAEWRGAVGLEWETFAHPRSSPALIQETSDVEYRAFLTRVDRNGAGAPGTDVTPPRNGARPRRDPVYDRRIVASDTYRRLGALWRGTGRYDWEGRAYVRAKNLERGHYSAGRRRFEQGQRAPGDEYSLVLIARRAWLDLARWTCNYGESLGRIVLWAIALILAPATIYALTGAVKTASGAATDSWAKAVLFSVSRLTPGGSDTVHAGNQLVEFFGVAQAVLALMLLGLFGFVLANKFRRS